MTSDDLILMGIAGLIAVFAAAAVFVYIAIYVVLLEVNALAAGDYIMVLLTLAALLAAGAAYWGTGLWLQKSGRI